MAQKPPPATKRRPTSMASIAAAVSDTLVPSAIPGSQTSKAAPSRIPQRVFYGNAMSTMLSSMDAQATMKPFHSNPYHREHSRFVMGYPLPRWQRELVWTDDQCIRFIQSAYAGIYLGLFIYNESMSRAPELDGVLVDGQQRLSAIERYLAGELAVPAPDGSSYLWTDLTADEKAHFYRIPFGFQIVQVHNEAELQHLYNLLNFGGTPHTQEQRA
jgi:hypothetical protein